MNNTELLVAIPLFIILLMAVHKPVKEAFKFSDALSWVFSMCVSALCIIGITRSFKGSVGVVLLPYAAMGISLLLVIVLCFLARYLRRPVAKERYRHVEKRRESPAKPKPTGIKDKPDRKYIKL